MPEVSQRTPAPAPVRPFCTEHDGALALETAVDATVSAEAAVTEADAKYRAARQELEEAWRRRTAARIRERNVRRLVREQRRTR